MAGRRALDELAQSYSSKKTTGEVGAMRSKAVTAAGAAGVGSEKHSLNDSVQGGGAIGKVMMAGWCPEPAK